MHNKFTLDLLAAIFQFLCSCYFLKTFFNTEVTKVSQCLSELSELRHSARTAESMGIWRESSNCIQSLAFRAFHSAVGTRGLEELIHGPLFLKLLNALSGTSTKKAQDPAAIGTDDPWCLCTVLVIKTQCFLHASYVYFPYPYLSLYFCTFVCLCIFVVNIQLRTADCF